VVTCLESLFKLDLLCIFTQSKEDIKIVQLPHSDMSLVTVFITASVGSCDSVSCKEIGKKYTVYIQCVCPRARTHLCMHMCGCVHVHLHACLPVCMCVLCIYMSYKSVQLLSERFLIMCGLYGGTSENVLRVLYVVCLVFRQ
jgi:hypothetical protein